MKDIKGYDTFTKIEPVNKGWSGDNKYYMEGLIVGEKSSVYSRHGVQRRLLNAICLFYCCHGVKACG